MGYLLLAILIVGIAIWIVKKVRDKKSSEDVEEQEDFTPKNEQVAEEIKEVKLSANDTQATSKIDTTKPLKTVKVKKKNGSYVNYNCFVRKTNKVRNSLSINDYIYFDEFGALISDYMLMSILYDFFEGDNAENAFVNLENLSIIDETVLESLANETIQEENLMENLEEKVEEKTDFVDEIKEEKVEFEEKTDFVEHDIPERETNYSSNEDYSSSDGGGGSDDGGGGGDD